MQEALSNEVLPPQGIRPIQIATNSAIQNRGRRGLTPDKFTVYYIVGKITYRSTTGKGTTDKGEHVTTFCLINSGMDANFAFCPTGNDMN